MKTPINISQNDLNELAAKAGALKEWLEEEGAEASSRIIPAHLTAVTATAIAFGFAVLLDPSQPHSACWHAGCRL